MKRVVSISPNAIEHDSRTLKFASSAVRLGYEAVVVENEPSSPGTESGLPFELVSPSTPGIDGRGSEESSDSAPQPTEPAAGRSLFRRVVGPLANSVRVVALNFLYYWRRNRQTSALLPEADVYWLHSFWEYPAVYLKARRSGARFLYDAPDSHWEPGEWTAEDRTSRAVMRLHEAIERSCARRAERFTTVSEGVAVLMEKRFGRRPEIIRNSHDRRMDHESESEVRAVAGVGPDDFLLVMSGNLKPGTAVEEALLALEALPDRVHIAFLGRSDAVSPGTVDAIQRAGRAHLLDPVPPDQVVSFIRGADASPILYRAHSANYFHALPNGFFHAVSAGLPILFPSLPEMKAVGTDYELGIEIDPTDPASIVAGVASLLNDPEALNRYRANVARASRELGWEHEEELIADMLAGP